VQHTEAAASRHVVHDPVEEILVADIGLFRRAQVQREIMHNTSALPSLPGPVPCHAIMIEPGGIERIASRILFCVGWPKTVAFSV